MSSQVQFRRGTATQNNAFTGAIGEITYDTDNKTLRLHDGTTAGGGATVLTTGATQTVLNKTFSTGSVWNGGAVPLGYGGTGSALTAAAGAVPYSTASGMGLSLPGTSGQILTSGGTGAPSWVSASTLTVGTAGTATTAQNILGGSAGQLMIQSDVNLTTFITAGAKGTFLQSQGAGYAPSWAAGQVTYGNTTVSLGGNSAGVLNGITTLNSDIQFVPLPSGNTYQRPGGNASVISTAQVGMVRYNTTTSQFEGYGAGNAWSSLGGVTSVDKKAYITAEAFAGAGDDVIRVYAGDSGTSTQSMWASTSNVTVLPTTTSVSSTTGALQVKGGAGIAGALFAGGNIVAVSGTASTSTTTGALVVQGGVGISGALYIGGNMSVAGTLTYINTTTEIVTGTEVVAGNLTANSGTASSSTSTGALTVVGGMGVSGATYIGGLLNVAGAGTITGAATLSSTLSVTGATTLSSTLAVTGATTLSSALTYGGVALSNSVTGTGSMVLSASPTLTGTLSAAAGTFSSTLGVTGATTLSSTLAVSSTSTFTGATTHNGGLSSTSGSFSTTLGVTGATTISSLSATSGTFSTTLGVTGAATLSSTLGVTGLITSTGGISGGAASHTTGSFSSTLGVTGATTLSSTLSVGSTVTVTGSVLPSANVSYNVGSSTAWWGTFYGTASHAQYADLAEKYSADATYPPGTVVVFGGTEEVTVTTQDHDTRVAGVVSTDPAYLMNSSASGVAVAMTGRVPCQVQGPVTKGQVLVTSITAGVAQAIDNSKYLPGCIIGKALESITTNTIETIEVVVGRF